jgi:hypothetical protein
MEDDVKNEGVIAKKKVAENQPPAAISQRKLNANRLNAKKSTGPKTLRGKEYSRRNALKHGLFARHSLEFFLLGEDSHEYDDLLNDMTSGSIKSVNVVCSGGSSHSSIKT